MTLVLRYYRPPDWKKTLDRVVKHQRVCLCAACLQPIIEPVRMKSVCVPLMKSVLFSRRSATDCAYTLLWICRLCDVVAMI